MSLKTIYLIAFLVLIEFFIKIEGNDKNKNTPTQNTAVAAKFLSFEQLIYETLGNIRYVLTHWDDISPDDQFNIMTYHRRFKINSDKIGPQPLPIPLIIENENILRPSIESLNNCMKPIITFHKASLDSRDHITRELSQLAIATQQVMDNEAIIQQRWNEIPDTMKIRIAHGHQQVASILAKIDRQSQRGPITLLDIIQNRSKYLLPLQNLAIYYKGAIEYLEKQRPQGHLSPGRVENPTQQNQGQMGIGGQQQQQPQLGIGGQKRLNQEQGGSGIKKKTTG